jgi:hypothetical protein
MIDVKHIENGPEMYSDGCIEACRVPDNLNRLARPLVITHLTADQDNINFFSELLLNYVEEFLLEVKTGDGFMLALFLHLHASNLSYFSATS